MRTGPVYTSQQQRSLGQRLNSVYITANFVGLFRKKENCLDNTYPIQLG